MKSASTIAVASALLLSGMASAAEIKVISTQAAASVIKRHGLEPG